MPHNDTTPKQATAVIPDLESIITDALSKISITSPVLDDKDVAIAEAATAGDSAASKSSQETEITPAPAPATATTTATTTTPTTTISATTSAPATITNTTTTTTTTTTPDEPAASEPTSQFKSVEPGSLNKFRRLIEQGKYEEIEELIWSNPRYLITVSDSAVYLMAGPKYNACHIAARSNKPDELALILDTISNASFVGKLYPDEDGDNLRDRVNHLLDSYLNTPDPRGGNTPLHFAAKKGHYQVIRVLLTFECCDQSRRDSNGQTAEASICDQAPDADPKIKEKIRQMLRTQMHLPLHRDRLKKRLLLARRRRKAGDFEDSDTSFLDTSCSDTSRNESLDG